MGSVRWDRDDMIIVMSESSPDGSLQDAVNPVGRLDIAGTNAAEPASEPVCQQPFPPLTTQASNLFQSVVAFVGDGCGIVDDATYQRRLEICRTCDRLSGNRCAACGFHQCQSPRAHLPLSLGPMVKDDGYDNARRTDCPPSRRQSG